MAIVSNPLADPVPAPPVRQISEPGIWLLAGAVVAGLAVAAGAFGTHGLRTTLSPDRLTTFETAVRYQMYHGLALVGLAALWSAGPRSLLRITGFAWLTGTVVFAGSVMTLALGGPSVLGAVAPIGGALLLAGWSSLALAGLQLTRQNRFESPSKPDR